MTDRHLPLGRESQYPKAYAPEVLYPILRADNRSALGAVSFHGVDIWNAWELTWLDQNNKPVVATAEIRVPASSSNLIESKSLKLYLGSFAMHNADNLAAVESIIEADLSECAGAPVAVTVIVTTNQHAVTPIGGTCIDDLDVHCDKFEVSPQLLRADATKIVSEHLHSHLLRSLCPVTEQPDIGSVSIRYNGPAIDRAALLRYIVSFREHNDFHEACIERMFVDIAARCGTEQLSVFGRYQRRGGLDINPFRSDFEAEPAASRLWRQ